MDEYVEEQRTRGRLIRKITLTHHVDAIRKRHEARIASNEIGGVREWSEIATLLEYIKIMDELYEES